MRPPARARQRLPALLADGPPAGPQRDLAVLRLLEEGTAPELRWLFATLGEAAVAAVARRRGTRQLSRRSRRFWGATLGIPIPDPPAIARQLWPPA